MDDIDLGDYKVTSEVHIFSEGTQAEKKFSSEEGADETIVVSNFKFTLPGKYEVSEDVDGAIAGNQQVDQYDEDGDLVVHRKNEKQDHHLAIKHHVNTSLDLVGLQVWRGALLLADFLLYSSTDEATSLKISLSDSIVELGAGTGLTSIVAGMVAGDVISTDITKGNILNLIDTNIKKNCQWIKGKVEVQELDFYKSNYSEDLVSRLEQSSLIIAADVVYHDDLTDAFLSSLKRIMSMGREKSALISLEKRYVFTINDLDVAAPCYEYFYDQLVKELQGTFNIKQLDTSLIPQYFCYERAKELVLFLINKN
nr:EOG090X0C5G [Eurycercus lamellatus]